MAGITFKQAPPRGEVIAAVPFPHPCDYRLWRVMVKDGEEYIIWSHNTEDGGYFWGHYQLERGKAFVIFSDMLREAVGNAGYFRAEYTKAVERHVQA